ncbi:hypothetical protein S245_016888, partial [Arachis hypogaea]
SASSTINDTKKVSHQDIELVSKICLQMQNLIERCLQLYMNKDEVTYVAGDRVVTDPLCKPFSIG